jgi:superfamily I DNA and/or RNA helicase
VDSWQGRENDIVILIMVANRGSGRGFTADKRRLNVALTRHRCGLVIFGDINIIGKAKAQSLKDRSVPLWVPTAK